MKVCNIGLDKSILDINSPLTKRVVEIFYFPDVYDIVVPFDRNVTLKLNHKITVFGVDGFTKVFKLLNIYKKITRLFNYCDYDLISVQDTYFLAIIGLIIARKYQVKLEIQIHGFEKYNLLRRIISTYVIKNSDQIRVVSYRLKKQIQDKYNVPENKIVVLPVYSSQAFCGEWTKNYRNHKPFTFLSVNRLVPVKNVALQINSIAELSKKYPDLRLNILGDGPERDNLEKMVQNLRLDNNIKFFGQIDNLDNFYKEADVFILTSYSEGWGLVIIEAASYGLPIIMTDVGCAGEVIQDMVNGLIIENNINSCSGAMEKLVMDYHLRKKLGEQAKLFIKSHFDKQKSFNLYKHAWERLL